MSEIKNINGKIVFSIEKQKDQKCELCGKIEELRPYGKNGENICFDCGMLDPTTTERRFNAKIVGIDHVEVNL
jgi:phage/plasmid primase-like uncharacterized protein